MNITVYCGSTNGDLPAYTEQAAAFGRWMAKNGHTLVYGGGNIGIMGVLADTVLENGGEVIGVIPEFLLKHERGHRGLHTLIVVPDMYTRKHKMITLGNIYVALPGGPGTLEEISEAISHLRLNLIDGKCVFFNVEGYYDNIKAAYNTMVEHGFMPKHQYDKILFVNSIEEFADSI